MLKNNTKLQVAFSVTNCICFDQRVLKMAETVSLLNCDVTIIGRKRGDCCIADLVPYKTVRFRMLFRKGFLFYKWINIRLFIYLLLHKFDILVANDLDTLLPNYLVSRLKRVPIVYDSHEYFTGLPELQNRPFVKWVWKFIEKWIFPKLKNVITVSESIAILYDEMYKIHPNVIRNLGKNSDHIIPFSRLEVGISEEDLLLILQGTGINIDKGSEELIDAMSVLTGVSLLVVGSGDLIPELKLQVAKLNLLKKVIFIPPVRWEILLRYTKMADLGMILEKDTNINYRFSLPNKLFDYLSAGIPVIASDLPETKRIITGTTCGVILESITPENLAGTIADLKNNPDKLLALKKNAVSAAEKLNWENECQKVNELYKDVIRNYINRDCKTV